MSLPHASHLLAAVVVALAAALSLAVAFDATTFLAALDVVDAARVALGLTLSALTAMVGTLVVVDVKTDLEHARSWQTIGQFAMPAARPAAVAPACRSAPRYVLCPQDVNLRRLLLTHRVPLPVGRSTDFVPRAPACAGATELDGARAGGDLRNVGASTADDSPMATQCKQGTDAVHHAPRLVASTNGRNPSSGGGIRAQGRRGVVRAAAAARLVANAGRWPVWPGQATVSSRSEPNVGLAADVMVLADRSGRQLPPPDPGLGADAAAPAHPGCRGPPSGEDRQCAVVARTSGRAASDRTRRPRTRSSTAHGGPVVIDNLPDHVPVGAAELDAIETYLDDVLREVLGGDSAGLDGKVP